MPKWPFLFPGTKQNVGRKPGNQVGSLFFSDIELRRVIATASFMSRIDIHSSSVGRCLNAAAVWWGTKIGLTRVTPPKSNMSPKKELFQQGIHLSTIDFQVKFVSFQGKIPRNPSNTQPCRGSAILGRHIQDEGREDQAETGRGPQHVTTNCWFQMIFCLMCESWAAFLCDLHLQ